MTRSIKSIHYLSLVLTLALILSSCQNDKNEVKDEPQDNTEELSEGLGELLNKALEKNEVAFVPDCDTEYPTRIYNRLLVKDCENITAAEKKRMSDALVAKARASAKIICELNSDCRNPKLVSYKFERIRCSRRLWEVDIVFYFICTK